MSFFLPSFQASDLASHESLGLYITPAITGEILNRNEIELFLESKEISARTQLFHVAGFHADFWLFIYLISHTLSFALKFKFRQIQKFKGKFI